MQNKLLIFIFFCISGTALAQRTISLPQMGMLPFTGAKYFSHGLGGEKIEMLLAGDTWISNRLPIDTEFDIKLIRPDGLQTAADGKYWPGIEVLIANPKKDTLAYLPDILQGNFDGFEESILKSLTLSLSFNELSKPGDTCLIFARFFDTQSDRSLSIELSLIIADPSLPLNTTTSTYRVNSTEGFDGMASGLEMSGIETSIDTSLYPRKVLHLIRISKLAGLTPAEVKNGNYSVSLYDESLKEMAPVARTEMETKDTDKKNTEILVKVPLPVTAGKQKSYYVRYRWESRDRQKVIDVISKAG